MGVRGRALHAWDANLKKLQGLEQGQSPLRESSTGWGWGKDRSHIRVGIRKGLVLGGEHLAVVPVPGALCQVRDSDTWSWL